MAGNVLATVLTILIVGTVIVLVWRPSWYLRLLLHLLRGTVFCFRVENRAAMPRRGPVLLVANHIAFFDALMILAATPRRIRYMVHEDFFRYRFLRYFFWYMGILRVPSSRHPRSMRNFLETVHEHLRRGEAVCVFPEGGISDNGLLQEFRGGIREMLPPELDVPVIPVRLGMLWGRVVALHRGRWRFIPPRRLPIMVTVTFGKPISPEWSAFRIRQTISELGAESEAKPFPGELPLHSEFARRAKRRPWTHTYKDFDGNDPGDFAMLVRSLVLSRKIRELDPNREPGGYVGVLLPNSTVLVASIFGVLFADRSPTVLNYTAGSAVLQSSLQRAGCRLVLTSRRFLDKLKLEALPEMVFLEDLARTVTPAEKRRVTLDTLFLPWRLLLRKYAPLSRYDLNRPAVLLFSSGSTGIPKGVVLSHRNINCNIFSFWRGIDWTPDDRVIGCLPLFHAYGFTVCFGFPAVSGTKSVMLANILDAAQVIRLVEAEKITLMITTPTFLQAYVRKAEKHHLKSLRLVITGAEKLRSDIAESFRELTGLAIVEGYGCTELSPIVSVNLSRSLFNLGRAAGKADSVGAPMPGIHVRIVDPESGVELPPNVPGMLLVKGGLVMQGYLNDPENTAQVITPDGFYRTGDIASMGDDGYITITGRVSRFSKIGGEMVPHELVERSIAEFLQCDGRGVAVTGRPDPKRGEKLVVFHTIAELDANGVIQALRERNLPNLWIPKAEDFIYLDKLPLLGSGKLDLQSLKNLAEAH